MDWNVVYLVKLIRQWYVLLEYKFFKIKIIKILFAIYYVTE